MSNDRNTNLTLQEMYLLRTKTLDPSRNSPSRHKLYISNYSVSLSHGGFNLIFSWLSIQTKLFSLFLTGKIQSKEANKSLLDLS